MSSINSSPNLDRDLVEKLLEKVKALPQYDHAVVDEVTAANLIAASSSPDQRAIVRRLEFRHTPKHGSWLNVAENELSAMTRQCLRGRRFGAVAELRTETAAWQQRTNDKQRGVEWQFRIDDARTRLKSLYPKLLV